MAAKAAKPPRQPLAFAAPPAPPAPPVPESLTPIEDWPVKLGTSIRRRYNRWLDVLAARRQITKIQLMDEILTEYFARVGTPE